jgi:predicted nuclease of predicted toxin-antitoxin system
LLDENLSPRLVQRLESLFPKLAHVRDFGLKQASDEAIWEWAKKNNYTIVTTDADFAALSGVKGFPPKVVHLEECDFPLRTIEWLMRRNAIKISEFDRNSSTGLLALQLGADSRLP